MSYQALNNFYEGNKLYSIGDAYVEVSKEQTQAWLDDGNIGEATGGSESTTPLVDSQPEVEENLPPQPPVEVPVEPTQQPQSQSPSPQQPTPEQIQADAEFAAGSANIPITLQ